MLKTQTRWTHGFFQGCMANKLSIPKCFIVGFLCSIMLAVNVAFQLKTLKFRYFFFPYDTILIVLLYFCSPTPAFYKDECFGGYHQSLALLGSSLQRPNMAFDRKDLESKRILLPPCIFFTPKGMLKFCAV